MKLGLAFQVMDDAMDYAVSTDSMGKNAGDDFFDQKVTLPVILAWQDGTADERGFWQRTMRDGQFINGDLATAQTILARHQAIERAINVASDYAVAAIAALDPIATDATRTRLIEALTSAARFGCAPKLMPQWPVACLGIYWPQLVNSALFIPIAVMAGNILLRHLSWTTNPTADDADPSATDHAAKPPITSMPDGYRAMPPQ